eukprot:IDg3281t1
MAVALSRLRFCSVTAYNPLKYVSKSGRVLDQPTIFLQGLFTACRRPRDE